MPLSGSEGRVARDPSLGRNLILIHVVDVLFEYTPVNSCWTLRQICRYLRVPPTIETFRTMGPRPKSIPESSGCE